MIIIVIFLLTGTEITLDEKNINRNYVKQNNNKATGMEIRSRFQFTVKLCHNGRLGAVLKCPLYPNWAING